MSKKFIGRIGLPVAFALALTLGAGNAFAEVRGAIVQVQTSGSVQSVVERIEKMVAGSGMMVMGKLHQGKVLAMTGLQVDSETIFVGSPTVGKKLFSADPGVGIVVPIRINVYGDGHGNAVVSYVPPSHLLDGLGNPEVSMIAKMLDDKLQKLTGMIGR